MEETKTVTKYVVFRESLLQSIAADLLTFGLLTFSIWFSAGSKFWTFVCFMMFFFFVSGRTVKKIKTSPTFRTAQKLKEWVDSEVTQNAEHHARPEAKRKDVA